MELKSKFAKVMYYVICSFVALIFIFPLYYTFINSLRELFSLPATLLPKGYHWENWKMVFTLIPFARFLGNSLIILGISIPIGMVTNFTYGYALAKLKAPGSNFVFSLVLCVMMVPGFATQIPQYILFSKLGITNSWWIWVFEAVAGTPYLIFLCRQYLHSLPTVLMEADTIDGCNQWQKVTKIALPLAKPLLAICAFRLFNIRWGDYMTPFMYLSREKWPLIMALCNSSLYVLPGTNTRPAPVVNAAALTLAIPTIIVFFLAQKQLQQGSIASGIKG